ncbi:unnamed protein product [Urochloa decumbens]|uniref:F-box domain-containing protein n=1 Tax=Urochloa decumbens TaxID=240449 RepID=A0ABC9FLY2_9POAL
MEQPRQPPELTDEIIGEIVLRLPPDDPACLVRASIVSKLWLGIISDHTFPGRYRKFHRKAPMLGFFENIYNVFCFVHRFVPITAASPPFRPPECVYRGSRILDCRHGRVLLDDMGSGKFTVWDPITGHRRDLHKPSVPYGSYAAVLCGTDGCDHLCCHGVPFFVVFVWPDNNVGVTSACVYSSETGAWGTPASVHSGVNSFGSFTKFSVVIGDEIHFATSDKILKYDMGKHRLYMIDPPDYCVDDTLLMSMEDGSLGFAGCRNYCIYSWSRKVNSDGVPRWMQCRVIELRKLIPAIKSQARVIGSAEGLGAILVSSEGAGTFMIELKSGRARKIDQLANFAVFPFLSFYTPDFSSARLPFLVKSNYSLLNRIVW